MKDFFRAVKDSLRYKWSIIGAVVCSLLIALLWGASISTIYPFVEVVLEGKTASSWIDGEITESKARITTLESEIKELKSEIENPTAVEARKIDVNVDLKQSRITAEESALSWSVSIQPYVHRYAPATPFATLVWVVVWLLATTLVKGVLLVISSILVAKVSNRTVMDLRREYYRKALEMDQRRIESFGTANLMTHLSHNMQMISGGLQAFYGKMIREPLKMVACLVGAALISWPLLLLSLVVVPAGAVVIHSLSRRMKRTTQREVDGMGAVFQSLIETFGAIKTVRVFNREITERRRFKRISNNLYRMSLRISLYDSLLRPITEVLGIVSISISIMAGAYLALNGETHLFGIQICAKPLRPSSLMLFYALLAGASDPGRKMSEVVNILVRAGTACENLFRAYDIAPQITSPKNPLPIPLHKKCIRFENVTFAYRARQPAIRNVNLEIPFGQTIAIVGGNGCGKSTLANLLLRFYDPHNGRILIDDVDIRDVHPKKLRRQMAMVTQDAILFRGTVWENIAYGNRHATESEIADAAKLACVDQFIGQISDGYQTQIGDDGKMLSAGQRQRIALARAIIADPRILILDEATSNIDGKSETILHEHLAKFLHGRTTILITHRPTSLRLAQRVVVKQNGKVIFDSPAHDVAENSAEFRVLFARSA